MQYTARLEICNNRLQFALYVGSVGWSTAGAECVGRYEDAATLRKAFRYCRKSGDWLIDQTTIAVQDGTQYPYIAYLWGDSLHVALYNERLEPLALLRDHGDESARRVITRWHHATLAASV